MESLVDGLGEAELADEEVDSADAPAGDGLGLGGGVVVDVRGGEDRLGRRCGDRSVEPAADSALAGGVVAVWNRSHSKSPRGCGRGIGASRSNMPEKPGDRRHFTGCPDATGHLKLANGPWRRNPAAYAEGH